MLVGGPPEAGEAHSGYLATQQGVDYTELKSLGRAINPLRDLQALREIRTLIRDFRPDIVHTHAAKAGALGRIAARLENVPAVVHTFHGHVFDGYFSTYRSSLVQAAERFLAQRTDAIIAISESQRNDLTDRYRIAPAHKVHVIPLGFDLSRFRLDKKNRRVQQRIALGLKETECSFGIIGRMAPVKNHTLFLDALAIAQREDKSIRGVVIGDGPLHEAIEMRARQLGLLNEEDPSQAIVAFVSWVPDIMDVLPALDVVVLTSHSEGTPVSLIEAQACGIPVISTDVGGVRDTLLDGLTGFLVPPGDAAALAAQMVLLARDPGLRNSFGNKGETFVESHFDHTALVQRVCSLYQDLLS